MTAETHQCNGTDRNGLNRCENLVQTRRPSATGMHWCSNARCQAAKQRFFHAQRKKARDEATKSEDVVLTKDALDELKVAVRGLARGRIHCTVCGYEDAIVGLIHPDPRPGIDACSQVGSGGAHLAPLGLLVPLFPNIPAAAPTPQPDPPAAPSADADIRLPSLHGPTGPLPG